MIGGFGRYQEQLKEKNSRATRKKRLGGIVKQEEKRKELNDAPFALTSGPVGLGIGSAAAQAASTRIMTDRLIVVRIVMKRDIGSR